MVTSIFGGILMVYCDPRNGRMIEVGMEPAEIISMDHGIEVKDALLLTEEEQCDVASRIITRRLSRLDGSKPERR